MVNQESSPVVANCIFSGNTVTYFALGGGMANLNSSPEVTNCTFEFNEGSAMFNYASYGGTCAPIITDCTSCGLMFKTKVLKLFGADDPILEKAEVVAAKIWEATDYLNHVGRVSEPEALAEAYTYHMPCHRSWSPTLDDAPRHLLSGIPQSKRVEMNHPEKCCGAAGAFFVEHKALSEDIRAAKTEDIAATGVQTVVTQCPSCRTYLSAVLGNDRVMHPIYFLAKAYGLV